jgi:hypothetical protein
VRTARTAVCLIWERPSVNVRQRLVMNVPVVTQLVTRLASESVRGLGPRLVRGQVILYRPGACSAMIRESAETSNMDPP